MNLFKRFLKPLSLEPKLVVSETASSTWHYHLRLTRELKLSGGAGPALCGTPLGWDTTIPLNAYLNPEPNSEDQFCLTCLNKARIDGLIK